MTFPGDGAVIGKEVVLEVKFHSRPEPDLEFFRWYPYDLAESISDNKTIGRYKAEYITEVNQFTSIDQYFFLGALKVLYIVVHVHDYV